MVPGFVEVGLIGLSKGSDLIGGSLGVPDNSGGCRLAGPGRLPLDRVRRSGHRSGREGEANNAHRDQPSDTFHAYLRYEPGGRKVYDNPR